MSRATTHQRVIPMAPLTASRTRRVEAHHHLLGSVSAGEAESEATDGSGCVPLSPRLTGPRARPAEDPVELAPIRTPGVAGWPRDRRPRPGAGPVSGLPARHERSPGRL